jgi:hypothetical protein
MIKLIKKIKGESGQAMILLAISFVVLCGMVGLAIDVGNITVQKGDLQNGTDAAALAGSQDLPGNPTAATASAIANATANGITNPTIVIDQNSITVTSTKSVPMYFSKIFGTSSKNVTVKAKAVSGIANSVPWIVPFVIPQPFAFNYDHVYVMRMYGGGPYPNGYSYPTDYTTDPFFKDYPIGQDNSNVYIAKAKTEIRKTTTPTSYSPKIYVNANAEVTWNSTKIVGTTTWYNITSGSNTGYVKSTEMTQKPSITQNIYPYQFDYMNVNILVNSTTAQYTNWLEFGYHEKFTVGDTMYYKAPSTGGQPSVDAFARRVTRDTNTDYTKAKVGDGRVILIPVVQSLLSRNTSEGTHLTVLGFAAFFIQEVHKNSYSTSFWFEGRFLENITVDSDDVTFDPNADYGVRVTKLIYE